MPFLWLSDAVLIAVDRFRMPGLAFVNPPVQLWETALFGIGLHTALGVPWRRAVLAASAASTIYVLGAARRCADPAVLAGRAMIIRSGSGRAVAVTGAAPPGPGIRSMSDHSVICRTFAWSHGAPRDHLHIGQKRMVSPGFCRAVLGYNLFQTWPADRSRFVQIAPMTASQPRSGTESAPG